MLSFLFGIADVVALLRTHGHTSIAIAEKGCAAIANLAANDINRQLLRIMGAGPGTNTSNH